MLSIKIEKFEGPLDLLLQLIEQQNLEISEISLAFVADQYLNCLKNLGDNSKLEELADFLVVASKLILIKSKSLLPTVDLETEQEVQDFQVQLKIYQEFYQAAKSLGKIYNQKKISFTRPKTVLPTEIIFTPPEDLKADDLTVQFNQILDRIELPIKVKKVSIDRGVNIHEKIDHIRTMVVQKITCRFSHFVKNAKNKTELIVNFLALLELVKQELVLVAQPVTFEDIEIKAKSEEVCYN